MSTVISTTAAATPAVKAGISSMDIGRVLQEQRKKIGLSQGDVAKQLGYVNINFISMIESGKSKIPVNKIDSLVMAYQLRPDFTLAVLQCQYSDHLETMLRLATKSPLLFFDILKDPKSRVIRIFEMAEDSIHKC